MSGEEGNIRRVSQRASKGQIPVKFGEFLVDMPVQHSPNKQPASIVEARGTLIDMSGTDPSEESENFDNRSGQISTTNKEKIDGPSCSQSKGTMMESFQLQMIEMSNLIKSLQKDILELKKPTTTGSDVNVRGDGAAQHVVGNVDVGSEVNVRLITQPTEANENPLGLDNDFGSLQNQYNATSCTQCISSVNTGASKKIYPLPEFEGEPESWLIFYESFKSTTAEFDYSDVHNIMRLRTALRGRAKEAVEALLCSSKNVTEIMRILQDTFGRAEQLIRRQMMRIKQIKGVLPDDPASLASFANQVKNITIFLKNADGEHHLRNPILLSELVMKLPSGKRNDWAKNCHVLCRPPELEDFSKWLLYERDIANIEIDSLPIQEGTSRLRMTKRQQEYVNVSIASKNRCLCDNQCARLENCEEFKKLNTNQRWEMVKDLRLCYICLRGGHRAFNCIKKRACGIDNCDRWHNKILHNQIVEVEDSIADNHNEVARNCHIVGSSSAVMFPVIPVRLYNKEKIVQVYAFVDDGASVSLIDEDVLRQLNIKGKKSYLDLQWLNKHNTRTHTEIVELKISGIEEDAKKFKIANVYSVPDMSLPVQSFVKCSNFDHLNKIPIKEYKEARPQIILSLQHAFLTVPIETPLSIPAGGLFVNKTRLGWLIYGSTSHNNEQINRVCHIRQANEECMKMNKVISEYFEIESFGIKNEVTEILSKDEEKAMRLLNENVKKVNDRYESKLLWKDKNVILPNSYDMALKRFCNLEKRFKNDKDFWENYCEKMKSYFEKGYAQVLTEETRGVEHSRTFYLPHFGVQNPNKSGVRIVFDAAAKVNNTSLNDHILKGPDLNQPLLAVLFKFRQASVGVCGDIKEMFHQIQVDEDDQQSLRFLWRENPAQPVKICAMKRLIFGAACSPTIAQFVKNKNAEVYAYNERVKKGIVERHYVDDYADSFNTVDEALKIVQEIIDVHKYAGFDLRNIISNSVEVRDYFGCNDAKQSKCIDSKSERILGIHWDCVNDEFYFVLNFHKVDKDILQLKKVPTKRQLLSFLMSTFDPIGFLTNVMLMPKLLMQDTWRSKGEWDQEIPPEINEQFKIWVSEMYLIESLKISRCYMPSFEHEVVDLHIFSDASERALSVVAYWRVESKTGVRISFVAGKSSCTPIRYHSIPKLELQAAVLAVRLKETIKKLHDVPISKITFWTDSEIVLRWIFSDQRRYKQYVANRVGEILECSREKEWRWCPSEHNPADCATRPAIPSVALKSKWLTGPSFLEEKEVFWPRKNCLESNEEELELKRSCVVIARVDVLEMLVEKYSKFERLIRVLSWCFRFINNCKRRSKEQYVSGELSAEEIKFTKNYLCKYVQRTYFNEDYVKLEAKQLISKESKIKSFNPFLDEEGVIRCNGRIVNATCIDVNVRKPIILPVESNFSFLIVRHYHEKFKHQFRATVISEVRQTYWIPAIRRLLNKVETKCSLCKITRAKPFQPQMSPLPDDRVTPFMRAFSYTGVDFFGPVYVSVKRSKEKRWVALFTCLTTRAVHMEVAVNMSSDSCILCIKNFINRRGIPVQIRSDNGSNFLGINKELCETKEYVDDVKISAALTGLGIKWLFNTPGNPSQGGVWERLVQSAKKILYFVLRDHSPRPETLNALVIEAENIINSRPLTHLAVTAEDPEPLTPNHFLLGCQNSTQTPGEYNHRYCSSRKQWKLLENLKNNFWKQWVRDYLPEMTRRSKWCTPSKPLEIGSIVLICDPDRKRSQWIRGRVLQLYPGKDGISRSAKVNTESGILNRPVSKLAVLDFKDVGESH